MIMTDARATATIGGPPSWRVCMLIRVSVLLTVLGYLYRFLDDNLRAFSQLYVEWGFEESTAQWMVRLMIATLGLALVAAPFHKLRLLVVPALASLLFELVCLSLNPNTPHPWLAVPGQALRLAPFVLLLMPWHASTALWILKAACAATFAGHGIEALLSVPEFIDFLLVFFRSVGLPVGQPVATACLHVIGVLDVLVALHVLSYSPRRTQWVLRYMIVWGAATALVRVLYFGPVAWHEVFIRNAHFLAVYLIAVVARETRGKPIDS